MLRKIITTSIICLTILVACNNTSLAATSTLITNAVILNGTGGEAFFGAVRIDGDRIIEIGDIEPIKGEIIVDAGGLVLAPGLVDSHSHHDSGMDDSDVRTFMQWEFTNLCSHGMHNGDHPRGSGAFPRFLKHYVRDLGVMELPVAIYKMTALSAASIGVSDRGLIRAGYFADLDLFDPATIEDRAAMEDSTRLSVGVKSVWVNGVLAFDNGEPTMEYPGRKVSRPLPVVSQE